MRQLHTDVSPPSDLEVLLDRLQELRRLVADVARVEASLVPHDLAERGELVRRSPGARRGDEPPWRARGAPPPRPRPGRGPSARPPPPAAMRPRSAAMSARLPGAPVPSITVAPRIRRSVTTGAARVPGRALGASLRPGAWETARRRGSRRSRRAASR